MSLFKWHLKSGIHFQSVFTLKFLPRCDVSKEDDWQDLWLHTETTFDGKVSLLVNNAGVNPKHGWKASISIMLTGVGFGTFLALEKMGTSKVYLI